MAIGRPSIYSEELAEEICAAIVGSDFGLEQVCADNEGFPCPSTVYRWIVEKPGFSEKYTRARTAQGHRQADLGLKDALEAQDASLGRLKWDARRWHASKLANKSFGEKVEVAHSGGVTVTRVELVGPSDAGVTLVAPE